MRVAWITAFVVPLLVFAGCGDSGSSSRSGCSKDTDCKGSRICVSGSCVSPEAGASHGGPDGGETAEGSTSPGSGGRGGGPGAGGSGTSGGASGASDSGATAGRTGSGGTTNAADGSSGAECTRQDITACPALGGLAACCTAAGTCGVTLPLLGCRATGQPTGDAGNGVGGAGGGGLVSAQCSSCRATSCASEAAACKVSAKCATLSSCIDQASPFTVLNCVNGLDQPTRTLYDALSSCASAHCASCPSINL